MEQPGRCRLIIDQKPGTEYPLEVTAQETFKTWEEYSQKHIEKYNQGRAKKGLDGLSGVSPRGLSLGMFCILLGLSELKMHAP
jgi:hypothetical protein